MEIGKNSTHRYRYFHHSNEMYGLGTCFRRIAKYPNWLPLFFTSDHGVHFESDLVNYSRDPKPFSLFHFTWTSWIAEKRGVFKNSKGIISIKHPYFLAKKSDIPNLMVPRVVYFPVHLNEGYEYRGINESNILEKLSLFEPETKNILACLPFDDFEAEHIAPLRKQLKTITAGPKLSLEFSDRLIHILSQCETVVCQDIGSQAYYALALGKKVLFLQTTTSLYKDGIQIMGSEFAQQHIREITKSQTPQGQLLKDQIFRDLLGFERRFSRLKIFFFTWLSLLIVGIPYFSSKLLSRIKRLLKSNLEKLGKKG